MNFFKKRAPLLSYDGPKTNVFIILCWHINILQEKDEKTKSSTFYCCVALVLFHAVLGFACDGD